MKITQKIAALLVLAMLFAGLAACTKHYKPLLTSADGINFKVTSLATAQQSAKAVNKPLFVFVHASWCPTCKRMEHEVLNQKQLGDAYNPELVNTAIDLDSPQGQELNKLFPVRATPTLLFFSPDGRLVKKIEGYATVADLLAEAKELSGQ